MQFLKDVSKRKGENSLWFPYKYAYCTFVDVGIGIGNVPCRPVGEGDGAIVVDGSHDVDRGVGNVGEGVVAAPIVLDVDCKCTCFGIYGGGKDVSPRGVGV